MRLWLAVLSLLCACGGDDTAPDAAGDAGGDAGDSGGSVGPAPPALPQLTPCAEGFREVLLDDLGVTICEPWPASGRETCAPFEMHLPGEAGCRPVGTPCPTSGRFATDLPDDGTRIHYVDLAAAAGGDGSLGAPHDTLDEAVRNAGSGQVIALAPGTYDEAPILRSGVTLWGACVAETIIAPPPAAGLAGAVTTVGSARVLNLRIGGGRVGATALTTSEDLTVEGVWLENTGGFAVAVSNGAQLTMRDSHVTAPPPSSGFPAQAVLVQGPGRVDLERVEVVGVRAAGVTAELEGSLITLDHVLFRDGLGMADGMGGRAINAQGGRVEVRASVVEDMAEVGAQSTDETGELLVEDSVFRRIRARGDGQLGRGVAAQGGASAVFARVFIDGAVESGLNGALARSVEARDLVVINVTESPYDGRYGIGVSVNRGSFLLERVLVSEARTAGMLFGAEAGESATGTVSDVTILDVRGEQTRQAFGRGLSLIGGASVTGERIVIRRVRDIGVSLHDGSATLTDLLVEGVAPQLCAETTCADNPSGIGLGTYTDGTADVTRFHVAAGALAGVQVAGGQLDLHDGEIRGHPIGANIQDEGFDVTRVSDTVRYVDNETNLDAMSLPVPEALPSIDR